MTALDTIQGREPSAALYAALLKILDTIGLYAIEAKKTSLHVTRGRAFLGVHPRASGLLLNIVTAERIDSERLARAEQVSRHRWHNEVVLTSVADLDDELLAWITEAYALSE